jgi:glutamate 5-kinase
MSSNIEIRKKIGQSHRWLIKIGSALLTNDGRGLDRTAIEGWVAQMAILHQRGIELVLVSSGAIAEGMKRLKWTRRPTELYKLQAAAAIGQTGMIQTYETYFQHYGIQTAQVLLTHHGLTSRQRYLNARSTLRTLINLKAIPIINENDTVATEEIRFSDNDTLAGLATNLVDAEIMVILTDQQGLYECDPRLDPSARLVELGYAGDPQLEAMASPKGGQFGRGGMLSKVQAANLAARSGASTLIVSGRVPDILRRIAEGETIGTLLLPARARIVARKQWLASKLKMRGKLFLDEGATQVLCHSGKSLLPIGVIHAEGDFIRGDMVICISPTGKEIACGLVNYSSEETLKILKQSSDKIEEILGYIDAPELIHRDNLALI